MDIKIYTTPTCQYCKLAKQFLDQQKVPYTEFNVMENNEALDEMVQLSGGRSVPVIVCGNDVLVGFSRPDLSKSSNVPKTKRQYKEDKGIQLTQFFGY